LPQDRGDRLVGLERELPFLVRVVRHSGFWPDDQHQPLARGDRVLNFLVKRQPARRHRQAVKRNLETVGREIAVQPGNEGRCRVQRIVVTAGVGEEKPGEWLQRSAVIAKGPQAMVNRRNGSGTK
jgi:hypothetical protein